MTDPKSISAANQDNERNERIAALCEELVKELRPLRERTTLPWTISFCDQLIKYGDALARSIRGRHLTQAVIPQMDDLRISDEPLASGLRSTVEVDPIDSVQLHHVAPPEGLSK